MAPEVSDRVKALRFEKPGRIPVGVSILPAAWMKHREAMDAILRRHPAIFGRPSDAPRDYDRVWKETYRQGEYTDVWGCVWTNIKTGMEAIVRRHPVPTRAAVRALRMPDQDDLLPHGFMYLRLMDLRGFEELMLDFAEEPPELQMLIDLVRDYNVRQARLKAQATKRKPEIVGLGDDLGMQHALPVSPEKWRKYLKPCFRTIFGVFRDAGHYVYFHTDGHIHEIIPDLIDCGVQVINPQIGANGLANLVRVCKGKVCVDLDLNRQMMPFWTPAQLDDHIREAVAELGSPEGGLWIKAEVGDDVPLENVEAICAALEKYSGYYS